MSNNRKPTTKEPLIFDIEAKGLLPDLKDSSSFLCAATQSLESEELKTYRPSELPLLIKDLQESPYTIAHNGIAYDIPALSLMADTDITGLKCIDTLILSRMLYLDKTQIPFSRRLHPSLQYSHGLKAWGYRLGLRKIEDFEQEDWSQATYTPELLNYCIKDVEITTKLYQKLLRELDSKNLPKVAIQLEHNFARVISVQENNGFYFNSEKALSLEKNLRESQEKLSIQLKQLKKGEYKRGEVRLPKKSINYKNKPQITQNAPYTPLTWIPFNPSSRQQVIKYFQHRGWDTEDESVERTEKDGIKLDEEVLASLPFEEAPLFSNYFLLQKRLSQLSVGTQAWLKLVTDGKIHGYVNTCGTITTRCAHSKPNMSQVPSVDAPYGKECRALFTVPPKWFLLGADVSGLELRCLAHYLYQFDKGAYREVLLNGDIHTANQELAGLPTRALAKTFIYAFLYGAGDALIGKLVNGGSLEGRIIKATFLKGLPALKKLIRKLEKQVKANKDKKRNTSYLLTIDQRRIPVRHDHAVLNTLLQSTGAIICKQWTVQIERGLRKAGLQQGWNKDYCFCANVHDEVQIATRTKAIATTVGKISKQAIRIVEQLYAFNCPLDAEFKIGLNWAETH